MKNSEKFPQKITADYVSVSFTLTLGVSLHKPDKKMMVHIQTFTNIEGAPMSVTWFV